MSHRDPEAKDFVGKTITDFYADAINIWKFHFSDGTNIAVELENFGDAGPGMVICETC
jgi:hypothetical protein